MNNPVRVAVLTGKRGGFGAMKPMLRLLRDSKETELQLIITDQHVNKAFGATRKEVEKEFDVAAAVDMGEQDGSGRLRAAALGRCTTGMSEALKRLSPDVLVLYGDRGEVLAAALAAIHMRIPVAHIQGGDISGNVDETIRHAVTKLSHLHFPSCQDSADRIKALGEEDWRIHLVGDNHVDLIVAGEYATEEHLRNKYDIPAGQSPVICLLHPETVRQRDHYHDAKIVFDQVAALKMRSFIVYPCSDQGYSEIVRAIHDYDQHSMISIHKNIEASEFWGLMKLASVFVGNSSAGLVECPYFDLPAVNVGMRQDGRFRGLNVIDTPYESEAISKAINMAIYDKEFGQKIKGIRPFGDGSAGLRIFETLKDTDYSELKLFEKRMTF